MRLFQTILTILVVALLCQASQFPSQESWSIREPSSSILRPFYIALRQNKEGVKNLERYVLDHLSNPESPNYGHYLSRTQIDWYTRANPEDVQKVMSWLFDNGVYFCQLFSDAIRCEADIPTINKLFGVTMMEYTHAETGRKMWRSSRSYTVPTDLEDCIIFVDGVSNKLIEPNKVRYSQSVSLNSELVETVSLNNELVEAVSLNNELADGGSVSREVLMRMYNISDTVSGSGVSLGAMEFEGGDGFSNKDLLMSQVANGVSENPISSQHIVGKNNNPDVESELDVQVMYWASDDATLWYEDFDGWMYGWAVDFHNRADKPEVVSLSWGWDEVDQCSIDSCTNGTMDYVNRCNTEFMKITASGTTILCASGDAGSPGRRNEVCQSSKGKYGWNHINPIFPGGSPWVLSVGATYVEKGDSQYNYTTPICSSTPGVTCAMGTTEAETTESVTQWTSGAGFTLWDTTPVWQKSFVTKYLNSGVTLPDSQYFNAQGRAYPDVSAFGHNCIVHMDGGWSNVDGTSCSSPIFAGIITRLNAFQKARGKPVLGFANPVLYKMYETMPETFHDIVKGNSSCTEAMCCNHQFGFSATEGYDVVSGLGTPNVGMMMHWLTQNL